MAIAAHPLRLILMGTGPFAVPAFAALVAAGHDIPLVVTRPAREIRSRKAPPPSPVREFAAAHGFELYDPPNINAPEAIAKLRVFAWPRKQTPRQRTIVKAGATNQDRQASPFVHFVNDPGCVSREMRRGVVLRGTDDVDQVVRNALLLLGRHLVGANVEAAEESGRIAIDDFSITPLGDCNGHRALAGRRRPENRK